MKDELLQFDLLPCPFCGGESKIFLNEDQPVIWCCDCPAGVEDYTIAIEKLVDTWNRRTL